MGIFCQISLYQPPGGAFLPGEVVSGVIKYVIDEPTEFSRITTSLKGNGQLKIAEKCITKKNRQEVYTHSEIYVDEDHIHQEGKIVTKPGPYELQFSFNVPTHIPPSLECWENISKYTVNCKIRYYIRIKFEKSFWFSITKHFRKEITISPGVIPKFIEPIIFGEQKKLLQWFSKKNSFVNLKATIINPVAPVGGNIELNYEVFNDTYVKIKSVKTCVVEVNKFKALGKELSKSETVPGTDTKTISIGKGDTQTMPVQIKVPSSTGSVENSGIISNDYYVRITVELPIPHKNVILDIPVQIGGVVQRGNMSNDLPPAYWEAMGEAKKENNDDDVLEKW